MLCWWAVGETKRGEGARTPTGLGMHCTTCADLISEGSHSLGFQDPLGPPESWPMRMMET